MAKNTETKKTVRRVKAGEVIMLEYMGENKPCERALALLLNPLKLEEGKDVGAMHTLYCLDLEKEEFLKEGAIAKDVTAKVSVVHGRVKAWFFEQIMKMIENRKKS